MSTALRKCGGFSLVELVIVIMIIGVLGAIAVPRLGNFSERAEVAAVAEKLRRMETAFQLYHTQNGVWPADTMGGVVPPEMIAAGILNADDFQGNPLGGNYDWEQWGEPSRNAGGYFVSVSDVTDWDAALEVDKMIDDGDLATGAVFKYSNRWLLVTIERVQ